ncbi:alpha/beta hydrolase [Lacipirellula sp.]|uniref:alpha/beta hydrolase n=1 Tax=Lacipirellula sp. TaxID=2691419 RepID=UPI003D14A399
MNLRHLQLDTLCEYPLGASNGVRKRNVKLRQNFLRGGASRAWFYQQNPFAWHLARRLSGLDDSPISGGVWPIQHWRCERKYGNPGTDIFPPLSPMPPDDSEIYRLCLDYRIIGYHRAANANEARRLLDAGRLEVRYATELTSEWYDPVHGILEVPEGNPEILGSHGIPIGRMVRNDGELWFNFENSWGGAWGLEGQGILSVEHFDRFMIEAWDPLNPSFQVPLSARTGIVCLEWKWSADGEIALFGREIINAATNDPLAWAYCKRRGRFLDVEEFFVWPTERGKGYGRELARMVRELASILDLPLRMVVSYADTEEWNRENLEAAARLLNVELSESGENWAHLFGEAQPRPQAVTRPRPSAPAFPLEMLRPRDEQAISEPVTYTVFFGTNRPRLDGSRPHEFASGRGTELTLGSLQVKIRQTPTFGSVGRFWTEFWRCFSADHSDLLSRKIYADEAAMGAALSTLAERWGERPHNVLYIHGFNTTFPAAIRQAARFGVDLKVRGQTFCFSWPSAGKLPGYPTDEATIEASIPYLRDYIRIVLRQTGTTPLSVIVHSMGNRALVRCLVELARDEEFVQSKRLNQLVLAAPDVDAEVFTQACTDFLPLAKRTTLYCTRGDTPLFASEYLHQYPRAGLAPPVLVVDGMDTVLVEGFNLFNLGHNYYSEASIVLHDIFQLVHLESEPDARQFITETATAAGHRYWKLPHHR